MTRVLRGKPVQRWQGRYQAVNNGLTTRFSSLDKDMKSHIQLFAFVKKTKKEFGHFTWMQFFRERRFTLCVITVELKKKKTGFLS